MKQPNKFTIKKPRITLTEEQKIQARSGMAGEAVKTMAEPVPVAPEPEPAPVVPEPVIAEMPSPETENTAPEDLEAPVANRQGRSRGRKPQKNAAPVLEDSETQHVRMSKETVMKAKLNVLLLHPSMGIRSLRDYGDAAFEFYEAHLRKIGKLPNR